MICVLKSGGCKLGVASGTNFLLMRGLRADSGDYIELNDANSMLNINFINRAQRVDLHKGRRESVGFLNCGFWKSKKSILLFFRSKWRIEKKELNRS